MKDSLEKTNLKELNSQEMETWVQKLGLESYRAGQIRHWLFKKPVRSFDEMTTLSKSLRNILNDRANITHMEMVKTQTSKDGSMKFLFRLSDGIHIESVLIPERDHFTLCISSQAGCAMGCKFCLTGKQGLIRNLSPSEIIDQIIQVRIEMEASERLTNIVLMGMGEPLSNYDNVIKSLENILSHDGMNFSHRKVTLSTSGIVPFIQRLGKETTINLAVSLNASDDATRDFLMPINRKYPLKSLLLACKEFPLPNRRMITFEYVLADGINDRDIDAENLVYLLRNIRAKINLIPLNSAPGIGLSSPPMERILHFQQILLDNNYTAIIRKSKGVDISAACGQLSGEI